MVALDAEVVARYPRFSLYNSPYDAHDEGCAIDLYPQSDEFAAARSASDDPRPAESRRDSAERETAAPSPVAGEVVATRTVRAPPKSYAVENDHLIVVDTGEYLARILHVDPSVEPGERVAVGDSLGEMVRSGFFAPWVDNHLHLGFRDPDANPFRASGSLPVEADVDVAPVPWDGTGTVVETADTYAILDSPSHPAPGERFAGVAVDSKTDSTVEDGARAVLDGGLPHYEGGGVLGDWPGGPVSLAGRRVGEADGRTVAWDDVTVLANGEEITGLSLFCSKRAAFGAKLVCPDAAFEVGEDVEVEIAAR